MMQFSDQFGSMDQDQLREMIRERTENGTVVLEEAANILDTEYFKAISQSRDFYDGLLVAGMNDKAIAKVLFEFLQSPLAVSMVMAMVLAAYNREQARALLGQMN